MYQQLVDVYVLMLEDFLPFAMVFGFGNLAVSAILRAAFGGRLYLK